MQINDDVLRKTLSKNIKSARISLGLTQESLAEDAHISLNFLKDIEGAKSGTSLVNFINLCQSLNMTPNQILKDFFKESSNKSDDLIKSINLLDEYQKDAVLSLINFFTTHN